MGTTVRRMAATALGWCLAAHAAAAQEPDHAVWLCLEEQEPDLPDQAAVARDLLSGDPDRVYEAMACMPRILSSEEPTTELVEALVAAYEREVALGHPSGDGEWHIGLMASIITTKHPLTIDFLTRSLTGNYFAVEGLLHFGPSVIPGLADLATSPEATPNQANGAMFALREAVAWWGPYLGPESVEAIRRAAIRHLEGAPDFTRGPPWLLEPNMLAYRRGTLFDHAAVIAWALGDPELAAVARDARHPSTGEPGIPDRVREEAPSWEKALQRAANKAGPPPGC